MGSVFQSVKSKMINFNTYIKQLLSEDIHPELSAILSSEEGDPIERYSNFLSKVRELDSRGVDTGLQNIKPMKGSSRAVFIPRDKKEIILDGQKVQTPYVHKLAIYGDLDRYKTPDEPLLGELQNKAESERNYSFEHGVIVRNTDGSYSTNPNGILVPVFRTHPEYHHLEMGYARDMDPSEFSRLTITPDFPDGVKYNDFHYSLMNEYYDANGVEFKRYGNRTETPKEIHEKLTRHPLFRKAIGLTSMGIHPADFWEGNVGVWTHPITGQDHPVVRDFGATADVLNRYTELRKRRFRASRAEFNYS
jgi:hypothetical protein